MTKKFRVLLVASHPVQYAAPVFRRMAQHPRLNILVAYCSLIGAEKGFDPEFGVEVQWDIPLLEGYPWVYVHNRSPRPGLGRFWGIWNPGLWRLICQEYWDAVVAYIGYMYASFWIVACATKSKRIPLLFGTDATTMRSRLGKTWKYWIKRLCLPYVFKLADIAIAPSTGSWALLRSLGVTDERIVLTPFVVDNDWWRTQSSKVNSAAIRQKLDIPADAYVVLFVAKLQYWKRPHDLLRAFARAGVPDSYLILAGDGPLRTKLEKEARVLGIHNNVRFLGFINQSELPSIYVAADVFVLPSAYDACAVAVVEAMNCGLPVIVSDEVWPGRQDVVKPGETGFVFPCGDVDALARVLREALSDRDRLRRMGEAARKRMEKWSPRENVEALVQAVEIAVRRKRGWNGS